MAEGESFNTRRVIARQSTNGGRRQAQVTPLGLSMKHLKMYSPVRDIYGPRLSDVIHTCHANFAHLLHHNPHPQR